MSELGAINNTLYVGYSRNLRQLGKTSLRLVTGSNIPTAEEGTGKLSVLNRLQQVIKGNDALISTLENAKGIAAMQDTALTGFTDIINKMFVLSASALDPTKTDGDRAAMNEELTKLKTELNDISTNTNYNGTAIFGGASISIRYGINTVDTLNIGGIDLNGLYGSINVASCAINTVSNASAFAAFINSSLASGVNVTLNKLIANVGTNMSQMSRLQETQAARQAGLMNAASAIRDIDVAKEAANFASQQVKVLGAQSIIQQNIGLMHNALKFFQ